MQSFHVRFRLHGLALWLALFALFVAMLNPTVSLPRDIRNYVFVIDITQSMNVRDMKYGGTLASRLEYAQHLLGETISKLPCGTKVSLALFANAEVVPLFTPIEVCANYGVLEDTLQHLDWRMAWRGSSRLRLGLQAASSALLTMKEPAQMVFLTDGDEAPPLNAITKTSLTGLQGSSGWLLAGVGADRPTPVPKLDANNQVIGYWSLYAIKIDVVSEESRGKRDDSIASGPDEYYLSALNEPYLKELAQDISASYVRADTSDKLLEAMDKLPAVGHDSTRVTVGWLFALLAAFFILAEHLPIRTTRH